MRFSTLNSSSRSRVNFLLELTDLARERHRFVATTIFRNSLQIRASIPLPRERSDFVRLDYQVCSTRKYNPPETSLLQLTTHSIFGLKSHDSRSLQRNELSSAMK